MFWALSAILVLATTWLVLRPMLAGSREGAKSASHDAQVYRDQLAELSRDVSRGVLQEEDAEAAKVEISRRLLAAADSEAQQEASKPGPRASTKAAIAFAALVSIGGTFGLYLVIGVPGYEDQPLAARQEAQAREFANRPNQAMAEAAFAASPNAPPTVEIPQETLSLLAQLREVLKERSTDLRGHQLLANNLAQLGQWSEAHAAQSKVIELQGDAAPGRDYVSLAEYQILAVGGYVSPEAETALANGLQRSPTDPRGRYYSGLLLAQGGRPDLAFEIWVRLLREGPADAPWLPAIQAQLPEVASAAGKMVPGALLPDSPVGRGPSAEAMEAAQDLSPAERQEMIRGMVAGLANRLATEGGPPEDWARLIRAYGVLGEMRQASDIWNEAREVFADAPAALGMIRRAAQDAEVIQ